MTDFEKVLFYEAISNSAKNVSSCESVLKHDYWQRAFKEGAIWAKNYLDEQMKKETTELSIKLQRTVNAAYHALLEMSAWMGIPEEKRQKQIEYQMENVKYCAEHDLREMDESQRNLKLTQALEALTLVAKQLEADLIAERKKNETPSN